MLGQFTNLTLQPLKSKDPEVLTVSAVGVRMSSAHVWNLVGISAKFTQCDIRSIHITLESLDTSSRSLWSPTIRVQNTTFGSLLLQPGTEGHITDSLVDGKGIADTTLVTAVNATVQITNSVFRKLNTAYPALLFAHKNSSVLIENTHITSCSSLFGIVVLLVDCELTIKNASFSRNKVSPIGLSVVALGNDTKASITDSVFSRNQSPSGGALSARNGSLVECQNTTFRRNTGLRAGAILLENDSSLRVSHSVFEQNKINLTVENENQIPQFRDLVTVFWEVYGRGQNVQRDGAGTGGAIQAVRNCSVRIESCILKHNTAPFLGGAVMMSSEPVPLDQGLKRFVLEGLPETYTNAKKAGTFSSLYINASTFTGNTVSKFAGGALVGFGPVRITLLNSSFAQNKAKDGGAIFVANHVNCTLTGCQLRDNTAEMFGGAIFSSPKVTLKIQECAFSENKAEHGGALFFLNSTKSEINNCTFSDNRVHEEHKGNGGAVAMQGKDRLRIQNSTFFRNVAKDGGAIHLIGGPSADIGYCHFKGNTAEWGRGGAVASHWKTKIHFNHCTFVWHVSREGGAISLAAGTRSTIQHCIFKRNKAESGGAVFLRVNVRINISSSEFKANLVCNKGAAIFGRSRVELQMEDVTFTANIVEEKEKYYGQRLDSGLDMQPARVGGTVALETKSKLEVARCSFHWNEATSGAGAIFLKDNVRCNVTESYFEQNIAVTGGAICAENSVFLSLTKSSFRKNMGHNGGALFGEDKVDFAVRSSTLLLNKADVGGATHLQRSSKFSIVDCNFESNFASQTGGSLSLQVNTTGDVVNTTFTGNTADEQGGAIFAQRWCDVSMSNNTFVGNKADFTGGAVFAEDDSNLSIVDSAFRENAAVQGSALFLQSLPSRRMSASDFFSNNASQDGKIRAFNSTANKSSCGFYDNQTTVSSGLSGIGTSFSSIVHSIFEKNRAVDGCVFGSNAAHILVVNTTFQHNTAEVDGAVFCLRTNSDLSAVGSRFFGNDAQRFGGVLMAREEASATFSSCFLVSNSALQGGVIWAHEKSTVTANASVFEKNRAMHEGGVAYASYFSRLQLESSTLNNNSAPKGGCIAAEISVVNVSNCGVHNNSGSDGIIAGMETDIFSHVSQFRSNEGSVISWIGSAIGLIYKCTFERNIAEEGAAINATGMGTLAVIESHFSENQASVKCGCIQMGKYTKLHLFNTSFRFNSAEENGAALCLYLASKFEIRSSIFRNNSCGRLGGIFAQGSIGMIERSDFSGNKGYAGAAMYLYEAQFSVRNSTYSDNLARSNGGAIRLWRARVDLFDTLMENSSAKNKGGAVFGVKSSVIAVNCSLARNRADTGGAFLLEDSSLQIVNCSFDMNEAELLGGALCVHKMEKNDFGHKDLGSLFDFVGNILGVISAVEADRNNFTINKSVIPGFAVDVQGTNFSSNRAGSLGGAVYLADSITANFENCTFGHSSGGGVIVKNHVHLIINNSLFHNNQMDRWHSGAVAAENFITLYLENTVFVENSGQVGGAFFMFSGGKLHLTNCGFLSNTAAEKGGGAGLYSFVTGEILHSTFIGNTAPIKAALWSGEHVRLDLDGNVFEGNVETGMKTPLLGYYVNQAQAFGEYMGWLDISGGVVNVQSGSSVEMRNCHFSGNIAIFGATLSLENGSRATVKSSSFIQNEAGLAGAVEILKNSDLELTDSSFRDNIGYVAAIGVIMHNSRAKVTNISISGDLSGGGEHFVQIDVAESSTLEVDNTILSEITTQHYIFRAWRSSKLLFDKLILENSNLDGFTKLGFESQMTIVNSIVKRNTLKSSLVSASEHSSVLLENSLVIKNNMPLSGVLFDLHRQSRLKVATCRFMGNWARNGTIFQLRSNSSIEGINCTFDKNKAYSGAIVNCQAGSWIDLEGSVFLENQAVESGGVVYSDVCVVLVESSVFSGNQAGIEGGAIAARDSKVQVRPIFIGPLCLLAGIVGAQGPGQPSPEDVSVNYGGQQQGHFGRN